MVNQKVCKKKYLSWVYGLDRKICHSGSLFGISDPRDRFFYLHHAPMKDTYNLTCSIMPSVLDIAIYLISCVKDFGISRLCYKLI